ncbi:hypothetical protein FJ364_01720 [Candidatus Dependentiae bacterium]|nr:hypothetical protein [Candidatus Dependentiae bacterium]
MVPALLKIFFLSVLLFITPQAEGMMGWLQDLGLWSTESSQATDAKTSDKKRTRENTQPQALKNHHREEEEEEEIKIRVHRRNLLQQDNGWECGYYSVFHYLASKNNYPRAQLRHHYNAFLTNIADNLAHIQRGVQLRSGLVEDILHLVVQDANDFIVIEAQLIGNMLPTDTTIIDQLNELRERNQRFWIILGTAGHWVCLQYNPQNNNWEAYDSIPGYINFSQETPIIEKIYHLCTGIVPLPSREQYSNVRKALRKRRNTVEVRQIALENGFTEETYDSLLIDLKIAE